MSVVVHGNGNVTAGRDVNINSFVDNSVINYELRQVEEEIRNLSSKEEKYSRARNFIDSVTTNATADVVGTVAKSLLKAVLGI